MKTQNDFDLTQLGQLELDPHYGAMLQRAGSACGGSPMWRNRKLAEIRELLALAQISGRLAILSLDVREDMRVHLIMRAPVPCEPDAAGQLQIAPAAELGFVYPSQAVVEPQAGYSFVCLLNPLRAFHPNIGPVATGQRICLGPTLPAGIRLREIIFLVYRALTLQAAQFNPFDSAAVMHPAAAEWIQRNPDKIPLTNESFMNG